MVNHQKMSYYDHGCLKNFLLHFMLLLTVRIVKNSHILAGIYFLFLKERLRPNSKVLQYQIWPQWKDRKNNYHIQQILTVFLKLITLILGENCAKELGVTKIIKQIKFEGTWGELEARNYFQRCMKNFLLHFTSSSRAPIL